MDMPGTIGSAKITFIDMPNVSNVSIGIIGLGFVGNAIASAMRDQCRLVLVDIDPHKNVNRFDELFQCDAIFVCVPSPSKESGECDTSILENVLYNLKDFKNVIISKTTAPPDVYRKLAALYPNLVHSPEFLTARNAMGDYLSGKFTIIGGNIKAYLHEANSIIRMGQRNIETTYYCKIEEAAFMKYVINSFLATKVVFMNEMATLANNLDIDWNMIRHLIALDSRRIGNSHTQVPGHDGHYGFGGMCFPKDTAALLKLSEKYNTNLNVLESAIKKNTLIRLTDSK